jgi:hypothetical protein
MGRHANATTFKDCKVGLMGSSASVQHPTATVRQLLYINLGASNVSKGHRTKMGTEQDKHHIEKYVQTVHILQHGVYRYLKNRVKESA